MNLSGYWVEREQIAKRLVLRMRVLGWDVWFERIEPTERGPMWRAVGKIAGERFDMTGNSPDGLLYGMHTAALEKAEDER